MDTSKEYQLMCKKSGLPWTPAVGDFCVCSRGEVGVLSDSKKHTITYAGGSTGLAYVGNKLDGSLWSSRSPMPLFRQDQLQDMVGGYKATKIQRKCFNVLLMNKNVLTSWEKLWTSFVVKESLGRIWNGDNWVVA